MTEYELAAKDLDRFISVREAAARLAIHGRTARRVSRAGTFPLPVIDVGGSQRISLRRLVEFIHGGEA